MVSQRILMLVLSYHLQSDICAQELAGNNTCADKDGTWRCCPDFLLLDGKCRALECLGAYGENCSMPCGPNTYGYRCRRVCHCVQNQVCDKYTGCMDREFRGVYGDGVEHPDTILALLIGLGSLSISMSLVFVGVMFWRWRILIQRKIGSGDKNTTGFQVNMLSVPGMEEGYTETYDDVRESKMILHAGNSGPRDIGQCRINSTEYDKPFNDEKVSKKTTHEEQYTSLECLGAYGENCSIPCGQNTYGYRCRRACHCVQNQVCDKYTGCMDRDGDGVEHPDTILAVLIGLGSLSISMSLVFVGVMFWRWRIHIQRKIRAGDKNTTGFQVNMLSVPGMEEGYTETYDDVREMIVHAGNSGPRDIGQCRINSTEYDKPFNDEKVSKKTTHEEQHNTIDACSQRDYTFVTLSDFLYDDCYVSVSQNAKRLRRISKSCSDVMAVLEKPYINIISNCNAKSSEDNYDKDALIEHL